MNPIIFNENINLEKSRLEKCKKELKQLPGGSLSFYTRNGKKYYQSYSQGKKIYLGPESNPMVSQLRKRRVFQEMAEILEDNIELMEQLAKRYQVCDPTAIQNSLPEAYQEQAKMKQTVYREEGKWCKASCGIMVRSRVEAMIADLYTAKGISFEYEPELILRDYTVIHPDFKVYVPSEERYKYHEHVGLLSDPEYRAAFIRKLDLI